MDNKRKSTQKRVKTVVKAPKQQKTQLSRDEVRSINRRKRERKRKIRRAVLTVGAVLCSVVICVLLLVLLVFKIETVTVKGDTKYLDEMIIDAGGIVTGEPLYFAKINEAERNIPQALPYIKSVEIEREFPDTVIITVKATEDAAAFSTQGGYIVIDESGKVLNESASIVSENIPVIKNLTVEDAPLGKTISFKEDIIEPSTNEEGEVEEIPEEEINKHFKSLVQVLSALKEAGLKRIGEISLKDTENIKLVYDNRITLLLGDVSDVDVKLKRAEIALKSEDEKNAHATGTLDLSQEGRATFSAGTQNNNTDKKNNKKDTTKTTEAKESTTVTTANQE